MAPFKSSLAKSASKLFGVFNQSDLSLRGATQSIREQVLSITASGGTKSTPGNGYVYHVFTSPDSSPAPHNFQITSGTGDVNLLVVGGGGGGGGKYGGSAGGGGGGAGVVHNRVLSSLGPGTYPITVGAGGLGNTYPSSAPGDPGDNTVWNAPGTGTPALTAAGVPGPQVTAFTNAVGPTGLYAGGGGGAATGTPGTGGPGGGGGGGNSPGVEYTGGGGAGQWPPQGGSAGYDGGKGIVIVRYAA